MAHPKHKLSKSRRGKRRNHYKAELPTLSKCSTTGVVHLRHRAYQVDGALYYRGRLVIDAPEAPVVVEDTDTDNA